MFEIENDYEYTREMYASDLAYNLSDEDCMRLFGVSHDSLEVFSCKWNIALETAYSEYLAECEYENRIP